MTQFGLGFSDPRLLDVPQRGRLRKSHWLAILANNCAANERRYDNERREQYQAFCAAYSSRNLLPIRAEEFADDDIAAAPRDRRDNDGGYEDLWLD